LHDVESVSPDCWTSRAYVVASWATCGASWNGITKLYYSGHVKKKWEVDEPPSFRDYRSL